MRANSTFLFLALSAALSAPNLVAQEVPDTILAEGVPAVPKELARELNRYQNIRSASLQDWVPGRREILITTRFANTNQIHRVGFPGGARKQLTFLDEPAVGGLARPGRAEFAFTTDEWGAENCQFFLQDLKSGSLERLTDGRSRNTSASWSRAGKFLAYSNNSRNGKDMNLYVVDPASPSAARRLKEVAGTWGVAEWSPDDRRVVALEYISVAESYIHVIDVASGQTETLTPRPAAGAPTVSYGVLINIHGGPEGQFRPGFVGRQNYTINELGIALVLPNVRGSSGYGKTYLTLDNGVRREDSVKDIGALLDWIAKQPDLDASRVAVTGGSYGGYMSLATMTHYSDRLRAGIDIVGVSSFITFLQNTQDYRRDLRRAEYGDERIPEMRAHLEKISPLTNVAKIKKPLLVVQGKNDPRVPLTEAEQILTAVRKNGVPVWYVLGKNEGHGFAKKQNQDYLQYAQILFLKEHLLPGKPAS